MPKQHNPLKVILIFIISCSSWLTLFVAQGTGIATSLLPFLRWEIGLIAPQYRMVELDVVRQRGEAVFKANVVTRHPLQIAGQIVPAGITLECSTLIGHLWQPLILLLSIIGSLGFLRRRHLLSILFLTVIAVGAIVMIDVPLVMVGALEDLVLSVTSPSAVEHSAWVTWMNFLNGGGRLALGFAAALSVLAFSEISVRKMTTGIAISHELGINTTLSQK